MNYRPGDILVTEFPYVDSAAKKKRPVVCIATIRPTKGIILHWALMITSTDLPPWDGDVIIADYKKSGLPIPSIVRTAKIACIESSLIRSKVGALDSRILQNVKKEVSGAIT